MRAEARGGGAWEAILCPLTLVGVVLAAYRPLLDHDGGWGLAQEWDDRNNFLENDLVRRPLSRETLRGMWSARRINVFEPLGWLLKARARAATGGGGAGPAVGMQSYQPLASSHPQTLSSSQGWTRGVPSSHQTTLLAVVHSPCDGISPQAVSSVATQPSPSYQGLSVTQI